MVVTVSTATVNHANHRQRPDTSRPSGNKRNKNTRRPMAGT
jgi:hypothetical protein